MYNKGVQEIEQAIKPIAAQRELWDKLTVLDHDTRRQVFSQSCKQLFRAKALLKLADRYRKREPEHSSVAREALVNAINELEDIPVGKRIIYTRQHILELLCMKDRGVVNKLIDNFFAIEQRYDKRDKILQGALELTRDWGGCSEELLQKLEFKFTVPLYICENHGASDKFGRLVHKFIDRMPHPIQNLLAQNEYQIVATAQITSELPEHLKLQCPPGFPSDKTYVHAPAVLHGKKLIIGERFMISATDWRRLPDREIGNALRHEAGHAIDQLLVKNGYFSDSPEFLAAYERDVKRLRAKPASLFYFLNPGPNSRRETFAEVFALVVGGCGHLVIPHIFHAVRSLIEIALTDQLTKCSPSQLRDCGSGRSSVKCRKSHTPPPITVAQPRQKAKAIIQSGPPPLLLQDS